MTKYVLKRIVLMLFTFFVIVTICFFLIRLLPRELPMDANLKKIILARFEALGYNKPLIVQYGIYLRNIFREGDFGTSWYIEFRKPALEVLMSRLLPTVIVNLYAFLLSVPLGILFGIYVILNGHLSAGGGFSGGAIIGAALILYASACGPEKLEKFFTFRAYQWITFFALMTYTLLKTYSFFTGANHLESHIPLGTPGAILSGGLILPLNICVGLVVSCTMYAFYSLFSKGGFGNGQ